MAKLTSKYNLKVLFPKIAKELHPSKNGGLKSIDITHGSRRKVWWKCKNKHTWQAIVRARTSGGKTVAQNAIRIKEETS